MITSIGSLGHVAGQSVPRTSVITAPRAVPAGRVIVVWFATDNIFNIFLPSNGSERWRCDDSAGNVYSSIGGAVGTNCFFRCSAGGVLYVSQLRHALTTSDTITVTGQPGVEFGTAYAQAMSVEEFDFGSNMRWAINSGGTAGAEHRGVDPQSMTHNFGLDYEWLALHLDASEGPITDSFTWDSDWTQVTSDGTNTGTPTTDMSVRGGYIIDQMTSASVDVTNNTAARQGVQLISGIAAVPQKLGFPSLSVLDDFNRSNEDPLDGGLWDTTGGMAYFGDYAKVVSNQGSGPGGSFFDESFQNCAEVYATLSTWSAPGRAELHMHGAGASQSANMIGLGLGVNGDDTQAVGPYVAMGISGNQGGMGGNGSSTGTVLFRAWINPAAGQKYGMQRTRRVAPGHDNGVLHLWADIGEGWEEHAAILMTGVGDLVGGYRVVGKLGLATDGGEKWDDFGGGQFPCGRFTPQIYRRQFGVA